MEESSQEHIQTVFATALVVTLVLTVRQLMFVQQDMVDNHAWMVVQWQVPSVLAAAYVQLVFMEPTAKISNNKPVWMLEAMGSNARMAEQATSIRISINASVLAQESTQESTASYQPVITSDQMAYPAKMVLLHLQ